MLRFGFSAIPTDREDFTRLQVETAKEIGGINTQMLLDAPQEIEKYHYGPLQIALCLFDAMITKYGLLSKAIPVFQDDTLDNYCRKHRDFMIVLKDVRASLLHQRYDNFQRQRQFVTAFGRQRRDHMTALLIEGARSFDEYLLRVGTLLLDDG